MATVDFGAGSTASGSGGGKPPRDPNHNKDSDHNEIGEIAPDASEEDIKEIQQALRILNRYEKRGLFCRSAPQPGRRAKGRCGRRARAKVSRSIRGAERRDPCMGCLRSVLSSTAKASKCYDNETGSGRCLACLQNNHSCTTVPHLARRVGRHLLGEALKCKSETPDADPKFLSMLRIAFRVLLELEYLGKSNEYHEGNDSEPEIDGLDRPKREKSIKGRPKQVRKRKDDSEEDSGDDEYSGNDE
ncbi:hypothetical protein PG994_015221 [Apiospora phragmitis]|uniref:Uncharacterized protein n=1 Tax=Apiospora phragmitis TaxID=2905665 RepID=A0ABR1SSN6_9PEZI